MIFFPGHLSHMQVPKILGFTVDQNIILKDNFSAWLTETTISLWNRQLYQRIIPMWFCNSKFSVTKFSFLHEVFGLWCYVEQRLLLDCRPLSQRMSLCRSYSWGMLYSFRRTGSTVDFDLGVCLSDLYFSSSYGLYYI